MPLPFPAIGILRDILATFDILLIRGGFAAIIVPVLKTQPDSVVIHMLELVVVGYAPSCAVYAWIALIVWLTALIMVAFLARCWIFV